MEAEKLFHTIINHLRDGVYYVDNERRIQFWNRAAEEITGYTAEEIVGMQCQCSGLNHIDEEGTPLCHVGCPLFCTIVDGKERSHRVFVRHKNGSRIPVHVYVFPIRRDGEIVGAAEVFTRDSLTVYQDDLVERLSNIAMHDALTQLPNRRYLESFLSYKMDEFRRFGRPFAVLFADIDNFGDFNNTYGHDVGDDILCRVAEKIRQTTRRDDLVGRWGGEEYIGIYSVGSSAELPVIGERLRQMVKETDVLCEAGTLHVTVSVGITMVRQEDTIDTLVDRVDDLMYCGKREGKDCVRFG